MRRVDFEMSQQRQVLPGLYYHLPPRQEKALAAGDGREEFLELLSALPEDAPAGRLAAGHLHGPAAADGPGAGLRRIWV